MEKKHGPSSESYVLVTILGEIVEENQLMNGDLVQLRAFSSCRCLNVKTLLCFSCCQKIMIKKMKLIKNNYCGSNDLISGIGSEEGDFDDRPPSGGIRYLAFHCSEMMLRFNDYFLYFLRKINKGCFSCKPCMHLVLDHMIIKLCFNLILVAEITTPNQLRTKIFDKSLGRPMNLKCGLW